MLAVFESHEAVEVVVVVFEKKTDLFIFKIDSLTSFVCLQTRRP